MSYGITTGDMAKVACYQQNAGSSQTQIKAPGPTNDNASLRSQLAGLYAFCERLSSQRNCLRDIADAVLGPEPEETAANGITATSSNGGLTADIVGAFENAAHLLSQIDRQIVRLQRVSS